MKKNKIQSFIWNTLGSGFAASVSVFFLIIVTRINGINDAGIFTLAFATSCILYYVGIYSGRTYQVTETEKDITDNEFIVNRIICFILMLLAGILFTILKGYNAKSFYIFFLLFIYKGIEAISDVFHGILQKNDKLNLVGISLFIRSILCVIVFFVVDYITHNLIYSSLSIIIINFIILLFFDVMLSLPYKEKENKINRNAIIKIFKFGFFTFAISLISNYLLNVSRYIIDIYLEDYYQTLFGIIVMPGTVIFLITQFIIQPMINDLKSYYINNDIKKFNNLTYKMMGTIVIINILIIIVAYFLEVPVIRLLYGINLKQYLLEMLLILVGANFGSLVTVISSSLIVIRKTKVQLIIYLISILFSNVITFLLVRDYGFYGGVYGYLITMIFVFILFIIIYKIETKNGLRKN